jgi:hypothetical protein
MSLDTILKKILYRWWLILVCTALVTLAFSPYSKSVTYQTSVGVYMSFNSPKLLTTNSNSIVDGYVLSLDSFSKFLEGRFASPEIQQIIAKQMGMVSTGFSSKSPFYKAIGTGAGSASISIETKTREEGLQFGDGVKLAIQNIEDEWNNQRLDEFKVNHREITINPPVELNKPIQLQALPILLGLLIGIALTLVIPSGKLR